MILCVNSKALKTAPYVQSDLKFEDIFSDTNIKYFDSVEEAEKEYYVPLSFCTSIRTTYSNKVVQIPNNDQYYRYYVNYSNVDRFVHKGYDLIMYLSALSIFECVDYDKSFEEIMAKYSTHQLIGLFNPDSGIMNPILYSHIIIADEAEDEFKQYLKQGIELVPIQEINPIGNISALLDKLIILKEVKQ